MNSSFIKNSIDISIVLPTFNESNNILPLVERIQRTLVGKYNFECIFVDDSSDDTAEIIAEQARKYENIVLVKRTGEESKTGLTRAFQRGFKEASGKYIICMDTDLQHPPETISDLLSKLQNSTADIVVASRYAKGGSAAGLSGRYRHWISKVATWTVWFLLPGTRKTTDPMTGFFGFRSDTLGRINLESYGFKILVELLVQLHEPRVIDVPFSFQKREHEESKANPGQGVRFLKDIFKIFFTTPFGSVFVKHLMSVTGVASFLFIALMTLQNFNIQIGEQLLFWINAAVLVGGSLLVSLAARKWLFASVVSNNRFGIKELIRLAYWSVGVGWTAFIMISFTGFKIWGVLLAVASGLISYLLVGPALSKDKYGASITSLITLGMIGLLAIITDFVGLGQVGYFVLITGYLLIISQGVFALYLMIYAWIGGVNAKIHKSPKQYITPHFSFSAIVPCKHERYAISDTLRTLTKMSYPSDMFEVLVVIHEGSDDGTIDVVRAAIAEFGRGVIKLVTYDSKPVNKPHGLNYALEEATGDVVVIFDAEDEPHTELFHIVNTEMVQRSLDVVQSGVQLMNYDYKWYSVFNVLEYYFWFKSTLHYFAKKGVTTLGGVTVFFKRTWLKRVGGWDITCLTEDADIGIKLSQAGANIGVVYDAEHATQEETPHSLWSFVKQRTRWAQGFLQIINRGVWRRFATGQQRALALYVLAWPFTLLGLFLVFPLGIISMFAVNLPPTVAVLSNIPLLLFLMFLLVQILGLYEFTKEYNKPFPWLKLPLMILMFYPYTVLLSFAGLRAMYRNLKNMTSWEKTEHLNNHRTGSDVSIEGNVNVENILHT